MADILPAAVADSGELRALWGGSAFTAELDAKAEAFVGRYPPRRRHSRIVLSLDIVFGESGR